MKNLKGFVGGEEGTTTCSWSSGCICDQLCGSADSEQAGGDESAVLSARYLQSTEEPKEEQALVH